MNPARNPVVPSGQPAQHSTTTTASNLNFHVGVTVDLRTGQREMLCISGARHPDVLLPATHNNTGSHVVTAQISCGLSVNLRPNIRL
ncbi:hypothetical protein V1264_009940 [Littorina saxatilis]|uniref:Uncharacterized protein n=1 Tax=Littorina saxatilis TaxID=31220 RepID=A0AAN9G108_9CAEN